MVHSAGVGRHKSQQPSFGRTFHFLEWRGWAGACVQHLGVYIHHTPPSDHPPPGPESGWDVPTCQEQYWHLPLGVSDSRSQAGICCCCFATFSVMVLISECGRSARTSWKTALTQHAPLIIKTNLNTRENIPVADNKRHQHRSAYTDSYKTRCSPAKAASLSHKNMCKNEHTQGRKWSSGTMEELQKVWGEAAVLGLIL